jgi:hypothetical protein
MGHHELTTLNRWKVSAVTHVVACVGCFVMLPVSLWAQAHVELDHLFIVVRPGAVAEMAALRSAGLTFTSMPSKHDGQGTASIGVLFENVSLELIWVDSTVSIDSDHLRTSQWFRKAEAWRTNGSSPFGLGLRRQPNDSAPLPVPVEREPAAWLEAGEAYELLRQPSDSLAADFFVVPHRTAQPAWIARVRDRAPELLQHPSGARMVSRVRVYGSPSHEPAAFAALRPEPVQMVRASEPLLELYLDDGARGERVDLRPVLPLVLVR